MIIELLNGTQIDIGRYNLKRLEHPIPSAEIEHTIVQIPGRGEIITSTEIKNRTIPVRLLYIASDINDYDLLRDEINALLLRSERFYIIFKREPYKKWLVKLDSQFLLPPNRTMNEFTVAFRTINRFAESVGTCLDLVNRDFDSGLWGWGNGIDVDREYQYEFTTNSFIVANIGTAAINPIEHALKVTVSGDFPNGMTLRNATTGDIYQYNEPLTASDTLVIDRLRTFVNGISRFGDTNKRHITLAPNEFGSGGDNQIIIEGGTVSSVVFEFRFMYK